jgi:pimeloyl-ACP methyl ester carboxylesterase
MSSIETMAKLGPPRFIEVDGVRIRYVRSGADVSGPPLLLLSPFPESLYAYEHVWAELSQAAMLVAMDLPGFGQSEGRPDLMTPQAMGTFVTRAVAALGLPRVHAIGPDVGTSALLFAANERPDMFESLVVGSGATDVAWTASGLKDIIDAPSTDAFASTDGADYAMDIIGKRVHNQPTDSVLDDYRVSYAGDRAVEAMAYLRAYPSSLPLLHTVLPGVATPVLSIWGADDPVVLPRSAEVLDRMLPHARSVVLDCGHAVWHDRPKEYSTAVVEWIDGGYRRS